MKLNMSDNILEIGKMYKTPWKCPALPLISDGCIDYLNLCVLDDGEYVVILGVEKHSIPIGRPAAYEYTLKVLIGTGDIAVIHTSQAGMTFWKKCRLS